MDEDVKRRIARSGSKRQKTYNESSVLMRIDTGALDDREEVYSCKGTDKFDQRWLGIAPRIANVDDERNPSIMHDSPANINGLGDPILVFV